MEIELVTRHGNKIRGIAMPNNFPNSVILSSQVKPCKISLLGINIVSKAVAVKTTKPILECILLEAKGGELKMTANNLNLGKIGRAHV